MFDLFVIGAGSGGVRAARMAAAQGAKVGIAEARFLGGTCVNVGCVPKKLLSYASHYPEDINDSYGFGWNVNGFHHNWKQLIENKNHEIVRLNGIYQQMLENSGVELFGSTAKLLGGQKIQVGEHIVQAKKILIAVGGYPSPASIPGSEFCIYSDDVFYLDEKPQSIAIVGGGYIACEFASIFNGLGVETHLLYRKDQLLRHFDHAIGRFAANEMEKKGVNIYYQTEVVAIEEREQALSCVLDNGETLIVDQVLMAIGRTPNTHALGLENTSVKQSNRGHIQVNDNFQTDEPHIFSLGDVIGTPELTPVALEQAMVFVDQAFGNNQKTMSYNAIPTAIFTHPNICTCGLSEEQVLEKGLKARVFVSEFRTLKHCLSGNSERVMLKMLVEQSSDRVLGIHMVGPDAGEIIQGFAVAVKLALTKAQIDSVVGIHPTLAEEFVTMRESQYCIGD